MRLKFKKAIPFVLTLALGISIAVPVSASGYPPASWIYYARYPGSYASSSSRRSNTGSDQRDTDRGFQPGTAITDSNVPLGSTPSGSNVTYPGFTALTAAMLQGASSDKIFDNVGPVDPALIKGQGQTLHFDYKSGGKTLTRYYVNPGSFQSVSSPFNLSVSANSSTTAYTLNKFKRHYDGNYAVVSLGQKTAFGAPVTLAVSTSLLPGVNLSRLRVLLYNQSTNRYTTVNNYRIEGSYVYITLNAGGELVFTDSTSS